MPGWLLLIRIRFQRIPNLEIDLHRYYAFEAETHFLESAKDKDGARDRPFVFRFNKLFKCRLHDAFASYEDLDGFGERDGRILFELKPIPIFLDLDRDAINPNIAKCKKIDPPALFQ